METGFVHLQVASSCAYLHAASSPEALVAAAAAAGMDTLALTDVHNPYGAPRFERACNAAGIRPIHGVEVATTTGDALVLLVRDATGWTNLCRLATAGNFAGGKGRPRLDPGLLGEFAGGLTALLLPQGQAATRLLAGDETGARQALDSHRAVYGEKRVYLALTDHRTVHDERRNGLLATWAKGVGARVVATNAVRMATPAARPLLDTLTCVREHTTLPEAATLLAPNREAYLKSADAMATLFAAYPRAIRTARMIAEECRFALSEIAFQPPPFPIPAAENAFSYLFKLCHAGAAEKYRPMSPQAMAQLTRELDLIHRLNYAEYFLFAWDIGRFCRERGILMQGRGSAANSVVAYVLGITNVDPLKYGLLFERFLSEERASPPDIDLDIEHERREQVIQYLYEKWGRDRSGMVCNVNAYRGRSALIDAGKALGLPHQRVITLSKRIGHHRGDQMAAGIAQDLGVGEGTVGWLATLVAAMEDVPRHASIHNGGFVVTARPLAECIPLEKARMKDRTVTIWDKDDLEALGYIKTDVLGLGMLTCIRKCFNLVRETDGTTLTLDSVPLEDPAVYDMFGKGDTVGVFQIESRAQQATLPRTLPRTLYDLVIETALIRPGPIQGASVSPLILRRQGREPVTYPHPDLEPILKRSYGVVLYQEQGMRCAMQIAGFTAGEADLLRRAMGSKRSAAAMAGLKERFVSGGRERGYDDAVIERVWEMIQGFALYGFPESHAVAFALLIAVSGYLKRYYPAQFLCALLNSQPMGFYSAAMLISDAERHGVAVLPPDIQKSAYDHRMERTEDGTWAVRLGLRLVAGVGGNEKGRIEAESRRGPYADLHDVVRRLPLGRDVLTNLAAVGTFTPLGLSRREAMWAVGVVDGRADLLPAVLPDIPALPPLTDEEEVRLDYTLLGCAPGRRHLMTHYRPLMDEWGVVTAKELESVPHGGAVKVGGIVAIRQRPGTAKGVAFFTLEDETGTVNVVVMPDVFQRERQTLRLAS
ncbi:MAG: error-prone DNA polymerase, partial [Thermomicrobia bacterium]|nr:error-prone DNA polymerase [Thermomicrobia bacterium]